MNDNRDLMKEQLMSHATNLFLSKTAKNTPTIKAVNLNILALVISGAIIAIAMFATKPIHNSFNQVTVINHIADEAAATKTTTKENVETILLK